MTSWVSYGEWHPTFFTLAPFLLGTLLYFVAWLPANNQTNGSAILKCLPIICLVYFVQCHANPHKTISSYQRLITTPVCCSQPSVMRFSCGTIISYQGCVRQPVTRRTHGTVFHGLAVVIMCLLFTKLNGIMLPLVYAYILIISIMGWYACAPVMDNLAGKAYGYEVFTCTGAVIFIVLDFVIATDKFVVPIPFARLVVMSTYYLAQLLIALSVVSKTVWKLL